MEEKRRFIEDRLKKIGINSIEELNVAIKKETLDISLMVSGTKKKEDVAAWNTRNNNRHSRGRLLCGTWSEFQRRSC